MIYGNLDKQKLLKELIEKNVSPILVTGPEGVGKFSFLKEYLKSKKIEKNFIDSDNKILKIETARYLVSLSHKKSDKRVILINDAHKFEVYSQNTFLKTLEETLSETIFILITYQENKILPTIRSRSVKVKFSFIKKEETEKILKDKGFSDKDINLALNFYPYQPGKALRFLNFKKYVIINKLISSAEIDFEELKNINDPKEFLEYYILSLRNDLLKNLNNKQLIYSKIKHIKNCLNLYYDFSYNLNFNLQIANLVLNNG
jgi:DNA polymerase-3 subunit delta'